MKNPAFPEPIRWCYANWRTYKQEKRQELRNALRALDTFNSGCAYIPRKAYMRYAKVRNELMLLQQELSLAEWGR